MNRTLFLLIVVFSVGCSSGFDSLGLGSGDDGGPDNLDTEITNQPPKIRCQLSSLDNDYTRVIDTDDEEDQFGESSFIENDTLDFNCAESSDDADNLSDLSFYVASPWLGDDSVWIEVDSSFSLNLDAVGNNKLAMKIVDSEGEQSLIKTFTVPVVCEDLTAPIVDPSNVVVAETNKLNYFNYSVSGVTGGSDFEYAWDFNGDSAMDPIDPQATPQIWTVDSSLSNIYSTSMYNREITLLVRNSCNLMTEVKVERNFREDHLHDIPRDPLPPLGTAAAPRAYWYIQADIESLEDSDAENQRHNDRALVTQYPEDAGLGRMRCSYKYRVDGSSYFNMSFAENKYFNTGDEHRHGLALGITGITDNGSSFVDENASLSKLNYKVAESSELFDQEIFQKASTCSVIVRVDRTEPAEPCEDDPTKAKVPVTVIYGEFECPELASDIGLRVKADHGKFYCEVAPDDQCIGGGSGGGDPPTPQ